jgi:hypothetical protein
VIQLPQCCGHSDPVTRYCYFSRVGRRKDARAKRCARDPHLIQAIRFLELTS